MKRLLTNISRGATVLVALVLINPVLPGCESTQFDPAAFLAQNTCNIFNCDTLFFLEGSLPDEHDEVDDMGMSLEEDHDQ